MELGCGNSQLCEELYRDGITDVTCIDLSAVAVEKMKHRLLAKGYNGEIFARTTVLQLFLGGNGTLMQTIKSNEKWLSTTEQ